MRVLLGITGASGAGVAVAALKYLATTGVEVHLVVSRWGEVTLRHECNLRIRELADQVAATYSNADLAAPVASGSFRVDAMLISPCSVRTLGAIASGAGDTLIARAADVALKQRRTLVLGLREAPLSLIHLRNAEVVTQAGGIVYPLVPAFYAQPATVAELMNDIAGRLVELCGVEVDLPRWGESLSLKPQMNPEAGK